MGVPGPREQTQEMLQGRKTNLTLQAHVGAVCKHECVRWVGVAAEALSLINCPQVSCYSVSVKMQKIANSSHRP